MRLGRLVVGVDFCSPSVEAARWAALHFAPDAEIVLVHAIDVPAPPGILRGMLPPRDQLVETAREGARARFHELGGWVDDPRVSTDVRTGRAAEVLVEAADVHAADAVVVGEHGCRPGLWELLGSTAERTIGESGVPVLLARGLPAAEPRTILVAVEVSEASDRELGWARLLAGRWDARVVVQHAVAPAYFGPLEMTGAAALAGSLEASREAAHEWLEDRAREVGLPPETTSVRVTIGDPVHEILAAVAREGAELVIMGSHGAGALAGGVSRAVLRRGRDPVLTVGPLVR